MAAGYRADSRISGSGGAPVRSSLLGLNANVRASIPGAMREVTNRHNCNTSTVCTVRHITTLKKL